jgi:hypothetical protein
MHALAKFGLATVIVTLAVLSNVLVTVSALSRANAQIQGALDWQTFLIPDFGTTVEYPAGLRIGKFASRWLQCSRLAEKADRAPPARTPAHDLLPLFASHDSGGPDPA